MKAEKDFLVFFHIIYGTKHWYIKEKKIICSSLSSNCWWCHYSFRSVLFKSMCMCGMRVFMPVHVVWVCSGGHVCICLSKSVVALGWPLCLPQLHFTPRSWQPRADLYVFLNCSPPLVFWTRVLSLNLELAILASLDDHLAPGFSLLSPAGFGITNGLPCFYVGSGGPNSPVLSLAQQAISPGCLLGFLIHVCYTEHETML